jgi:chromosome partitioning protein
MHIILSLIEDDLVVASLDLDFRQQTLSRYVENREEFARVRGIDLPMPIHRIPARSELPVAEQAQAEEREQLEEIFAELRDQVDVIIIDCPGSDNYLSRLAHSYADTLITPMNDSFVDLDLLARVDPDSLAVEGPSVYAEMVWESRKRRAMRDRGAIDWIIIRNRIASLEARNMQRIRKVLGDLGRRIGFRSVPGLSERVIYRELFLKGLTLLDLRRPGMGADGVSELTLSQVAARQELRRLIDNLHLPVRERTTALRPTG